MEHILRNAILALPQNDFASRQQIYDKARHSIARLDDGKSSPSRDEMMAYLEKVIGKIEAEHEPPAIFTNPEPALETSPSIEAPALPNAQDNGSSSRTKWFVAALGLILVCTTITYFYLSGSAELVAQNKRVIGFENFTTDFVSNAKRDRSITKQKAVLATSLFEGSTTLIATGQGSLFLKDYIPVDTSKRYRLSVRLRIKERNGAPAATRTIVGLATYDKDKKLQLSKPGAHRYGTLNRTISSAKGWQTYTGVFSGAGDLSHNMMRVGTTFVRPMVLFNFKSKGDIQTEIARIIFEEVDEKAEE